MEALVILLGEFLLAPFIAVFCLFFEGMIALLAFFFEVLFSLFGVRALAREEENNESFRDEKVKKVSEEAKSTFPRFVKFVKRGALVLLSASVITIFSIQFLFFEDAIRWIAYRIQKKASTEIDFREVRGSLFSGRFEFEGLHLIRHDHPESAFDLTVERVSFDLHLLHIFSGYSELEELRLQGLSGSFERKSSSEKRRAPRRPFQVSDLSVSDSSISLTLPARSGDVQQIELTVNTLYTSPFRSSDAVFDLLFRTTLDGTFGEGSLVFETREISGGRETTWNVKELSLSKIAAFLPTPLSWADSGVLNATISDRWSLEGNVDIDMDWKLEIVHPHVTIPNDLQFSVKAFALPIAGLLNRAPRIPISFSLVLNRGAFSSSASPETLHLWSQASDLFIEQLAKFVNKSPEDIKGAAGAGFQKFQDFLGKRKK